MRKMPGNLWRRTLEMALRIHYLRDKKPATSVVFTTSGVASQTVPIIPAHLGDLPKSSVFQRQLVIHTSITTDDTTSSAFRAYFRGLDVVVKMAEDDLMAQLRHEAEIYQKLEDIQGDVIPHMYGLFILRGSCALLVLEDCGTSIKSFSHLTEPQR
jgi:hypothetical protein